MLHKFFLLLAFAAAGLAIWYAVFYESPVPNARYPIAYAWLSLLSAIIFTGLWFAGFVKRSKEKANALTD